MKTFIPSSSDIEKKNWVLLDAEEQVLGRLAVQIADTLRGKNKPTFTPHLDCGDHVIVINAEKVALTGAKNEKKQYATYTGHMGGLSFTPAKEIREKFPERLVLNAVKNMMPKNRLGRAMFSKLRVYAGTDHPHAAQNPTKIN
mgnify:CR=1 FL=1